MYGGECSIGRDKTENGTMVLSLFFHLPVGTRGHAKRVPLALVRHAMGEKGGLLGHARIVHNRTSFFPLISCVDACRNFSVTFQILSVPPFAQTRRAPKTAEGPAASGRGVRKSHVLVAAGSRLTRVARVAP